MKSLNPARGISRSSGRADRTTILVCRCGESRAAAMTFRNCLRAIMSNPPDHYTREPCAKIRAMRALAVLISIFFLALPAVAHPVPFSYLDIQLQPGSIEV